MTQDITGWLTEIRVLQQQLAAACQERDQAYRSAANWRSLYDAEAKQRREDVGQLQLTIDALRTEISALQKQEAVVDQADRASSAGSKANLSSVDALRAELDEVLEQCSHLQQALNQERRDHEETRQSLTMALGETIDALRPDSQAAIPPSEKKAAETNPSN